MTRAENTDRDATRADLADFDIGAKLGSGTSATVYKAHHRTLLATVALKRWHRTATEDELRKFLDECRLQWQLSNEPNIVRLYWVGTPSDAPPWLAMELYDFSLDRRLEASPALSVEESIRIARDLLAGLSAIHVNGHLHRDIKPANVLLKGGQAALSDLGIAMEANAWTSDRAAGTARYLAPELGRGKDPSYRSDVYSAALTIETAFNYEIPDYLDELLTRASSHNAEDRPQNGSDFAAALDDALERKLGSPLPAWITSSPAATATGDVRRRPRRIGRSRGTRPRRRRWRRRAGRLTAAIAVGGLLAAGTLYFLRQSDGKAPLLSTPAYVSAAGPGPVTPDGTKFFAVINDKHAIAVIDTRTFKVLKIIPTGEDIPIKPVVRPDGAFVYFPARRGTSLASDLLVVSTTTYALTRRTLEDSALPIGLTLAPNGKTLYVTSQGNATHLQSVSVVDTSTNKVKATLQVAAPGATILRMQIRADGAFGYLVNDGTPGYLYVVDLKTLKYHALPVAPFPQQAFIVGGGRYLMLTNSGSPARVAFLDVNTNVIRRDVTMSQIAVRPTSIPDSTGGLVMTRGNSTSPGTLYYMDPAQDAPYRHADIGYSPRFLNVSPDGTHAYVLGTSRATPGKPSTATVSIVNLATFAVSKPLAAGSDPGGLAVSGDGKDVYVTNDNAGTITVIDVSTQKAVTIRPLG